MEQKNADELKARSRAAFDAQAETYDAGMQGDHARGLYRIVAGEVARACGGIDSPRVLDLGCGTGALAEIVLDEIPGCALVGVDLSANMAERAAERLGGRAEVVVGDAERLPFRDNSFDAAYCNDSFHHYPDPALAAFQVWRALRPGGTFVVGDVWQPAPARAVMNAWMPHSAEGDVRIYSEGEMREDPRHVVRQRELAADSASPPAWQSREKTSPFMSKMEKNESTRPWNKPSRSRESAENYLRAVTWRFSLFAWAMPQRRHREALGHLEGERLQGPREVIGGGSCRGRRP